MRSPRLAAMGVATLSGLIPTLLDPTITATITRPDEAQDEDLKWELGITVLYDVFSVCTAPSAIHSSAAVCAFVWPRDSAAMKAVVTLLAHRTAAWVTSTLPLVRPPRPTAATAARKPTTVAWTWTWGTDANSVAISVYNSLSIITLTKRINCVNITINY